MQNNEEILLKVENLSQYFGFTKAVDDVSFDIKKGEVFGLVGESGCGKTTTGRSIIKLYNITGGNVFFKGIRIAAGKKTYQDAIKNAQSEFKAACKEFDEQAVQLKEQMNKTVAEQEALMKKDSADKKACNEAITKAKREYREASQKHASEIAQKKAQLKEKMNATIAQQRKLMKEAEFDQKNCDKEYSKQLQAQAKEKYSALLAKADDAAKPAIKAEYKDALRKAKNTKLVTQIQMIFQDPIASLDPRMTVKEIISEGLVIQGERNKEVLDEKVYEMLELVGLVREHASRYPHEFSGGQRQRIGVARSIIMNPELIIADEPVSALDVSVQAQVINLLNELREKFGLTILFIAHDLSVVKYFSDRIGVMYFGKMVELATTDELFKNPLHP